MRPGLLDADRDLDPAELPEPDPALLADLGLDRLIAAMTRGDRDLDDIVRRVVPTPLLTVDAIRYRQASVRDALASPDVVRELYGIAVDAVDAERKVWGSAMRNAELVLDRAAEVLGLFLASFRAMRGIEAAHASAFTSPGFTALFELIATQLDDAWLAEADDHVHRLRSRTLHVSARLGPGNRGTGYVLHRRPTPVRGLRGRLGLEERRGTVEVLLRDQNAMNMIAELRALADRPDGRRRPQIGAAGPRLLSDPARGVGVPRRLREPARGPHRGRRHDVSARARRRRRAHVPRHRTL